MNIKEREKDYLVYLLWLFGVIPSNILRNYIVVKSPTLRAQKVLYFIEQVIYYLTRLIQLSFESRTKLKKS